MSRLTRHVKRALCRHRVIVADSGHHARCQLCGEQLASDQSA